MVTVSAAYGTGGSLVAPRLAVRLGLPFADRLIPARAARSASASDQSEKGDQEQEGGTSFFRRVAQVAGGLNFPVPNTNDRRVQVRSAVESSIEELARTTGAVILGRAGAVVLAGRHRTFHVRLSGPVDRRAARGQEIEHISLAAARARLEETDQARARYVNRLYGRDPTDPSLYHLVVDSTVFSVDDCVELLAAAAASFWKGAGRATDSASPGGEERNKRR